jgi:rubrerythrin
VWLICSRRCGGALFRPLFAEVEVDASGEYQGHQLLQPGYICLNCGAPAMDLGDVPTTMATDADEDLAATAADVLCPVCETLVSVIPGDDCPNCGASLEVAPS